jgi:hypothetical protein
VTVRDSATRRRQQAGQCKAGSGAARRWILFREELSIKIDLWFKTRSGRLPASKKLQNKTLDQLAQDAAST